MFDNRLVQIVALDVAKGLARHPRQRPLENLFLKTVAARTFGEPDHINLHAGEEPLRLLIEKQQAHVLGPRRFGRAARHVHLPPQCFGRKLGASVASALSTSCKKTCIQGLDK